MKINTHHLSLLSLPLVLGTTLAFAGSARAEENALILIDVSGSMAGRSSESTFKKDVARDLAKAFVDEVHDSREYALWTFSGTTYTEVVPFGRFNSSLPAHKTELKRIIDAELPEPRGMTPLAKSLCDAIDHLIAYESKRFPIPEKRVVLQSDGLENNTPNIDQCYGPDSVARPPMAFDVDSWEWKVINKARTGNAAVPIDPGRDYWVIVDSDALLAHYIPTFSGFSAGFAAAPAAEPTPVPGPEVVPGTIVVQPRIPLIERLPRLTAGTPIPLSSPLVKGHPGLSFYSNLSSATSGRYREIDGTKPLPQLGDVTGDGCVDNADYQVLSASWGRTVPRGAQADINRDRKVNYYDYLNIVQNMGKGCNQ